MASKGFDTKAALLRSGKREFLEHGFEGASLRRICANANVTTGAFYAHFRKKDDLFRTLVEEELSDYNRVYQGLIDRIVGNAMTSDDGEVHIMEYIVDHRDLFKLLFDCSLGTPYAGFKDELLARFDATYQRIFDVYAPGSVDPYVTRTVVRMKFAQYCEMIYGDYDRGRIRLITERLAAFTKAGFEALMGIKLESPG